MSNEATITVNIGIELDHLSYNEGGGFSADVSLANGPTPGVLLVSTTGTDVSLVQLTTPGLCYIKNLDTVNFVHYGIRDVETSRYYPLGELLPGEEYVLRLARYLGQEYTDTGTSPATNKLHFRSDTAACRVRVEAFEK